MFLAQVVWFAFYPGKRNYKAFCWLVEYFKGTALTILQSLGWNYKLCPLTVIREGYLTSVLNDSHHNQTTLKHSKVSLTSQEVWQDHVWKKVWSWINANYSLEGNNGQECPVKWNTAVMLLRLYSCALSLVSSLRSDFDLHTAFEMSNVMVRNLWFVLVITWTFDNMTKKTYGFKRLCCVIK